MLELEMLGESMIMSLQHFNSPRTLSVGSTCRYWSGYKVGLNPTLCIQSSSVVLQNDGGSDFTETKKGPISVSALQNSQKTSLLSEVNTIGVIGGVSAVSTLNFVDKLVRWSSDGEETLPFIVCSDPVLNKNLLLCERSSYTDSKIEKSGKQLKPNPIVENLRRKIAFLEQAGARCIVMPCHISHAWHDEISKDCSLPFLHVGECVAKELKKANFKPLEAGSSLRIGVLATPATLKAGVYQEKLQSEGFEFVLPDKATMEHTVIPAIEALNRKDIEGARNLFRIALQVLLVRAVNTVILASDDMRGLLPRKDPLLKRCVDPMDALARSTINWAKSFEKEGKNT